MRRRRPRPAPLNRFQACSRCAGGLLIEEVIRGGRREREARRCECLRVWLRQERGATMTPVEKERRDLA
jgi:hypothetical protein